MKTTVKKWAFNLVLLSLMASCGGDNNSTGGGSSNDNINNDINNSTVSSGTASAQGFIRAFENDGFAGSGKGRRFFYRSSSSSNRNCKEKWGFLTICTSSGHGDFYQGGHREVDHKNGKVKRFNQLANYDDFGANLGAIKGRLLARMRSAQKNGDAYKCLQYFGFPEFCFSREQWADIYDECRESNNSSGSGWPPYPQTSLGCQQILSRNPVNAKSQKYVFKNDDVSFMVNLNKALGAQPTAIHYSSDGTTFVHSN